MCFLITAGHLNTPKCFNVSLYLPSFYFSRSSGYIYTSTQEKARESLQHWAPDGPNYPTAWWLLPWLTHLRLSQYSSLQGFLRKQTSCMRLHEISLSPPFTACQYTPVSSEALHDSTYSLATPADTKDSLCASCHDNTSVMSSTTVITSHHITPHHITPLQTL